MTRDEAIKLILQRCGNRADDTVLQAAAVLEMALAQETVLEQADFKPWFLLSEVMRASTGAAEQRMPLPDRFLEEHEEGLLWIKNPSSGKYEPLTRDDADKLEDYYGETQSRKPEKYAIVRNYIVLFPVPDLAYPLKMRCYQREVTLTYAFGSEAGQVMAGSPVTNAWLTNAADWIIGETGAQIAGQYLKDRETAARFQEDANKAKQRLYVQHIAREEANRDRSAGDD